MKSAAKPASHTRGRTVPSVQLQTFLSGYGTRNPSKRLVEVNGIHSTCSREQERAQARLREQGNEAADDTLHRHTHFDDPQPSRCSGLLPQREGTLGKLKRHGHATRATISTR